MTEFPFLAVLTLSILTARVWCMESRWSFEDHDHWSNVRPADSPERGGIPFFFQQAANDFGQASNHQLQVPSQAQSQDFTYQQYPPASHYGGQVKQIQPNQQSDSAIPYYPTLLYNYQADGPAIQHHQIHYTSPPQQQSYISQPPFIAEHHVQENDPFWANLIDLGHEEEQEQEPRITVDSSTGSFSDENVVYVDGSDGEADNDDEATSSSMPAIPNLLQERKRLGKQFLRKTWYTTLGREKAEEVLSKIDKRWQYGPKRKSELRQRAFRVIEEDEAWKIYYSQDDDEIDQILGIHRQRYKKAAPNWWTKLDVDERVMLLKLYQKTHQDCSNVTARAYLYACTSAAEARSVVGLPKEVSPKVAKSNRFHKSKVLRRSSTTVQTSPL